jgi:hypothetical protein
MGRSITHVLAYVEQALEPTLRPGDVVVLDHLAMPEQRAVQAAIEHVGGGIRFWPPYSPDFNPIEQAFAKLKAFFRAARSRSFDQVAERVRDRARVVFPYGMPELCPALWLPSSYGAMKNALTSAAARGHWRSQLGIRHR